MTTKEIIIKESAWRKGSIKLEKAISEAKEVNSTKSRKSGIRIKRLKDLLILI